MKKIYFLSFIALAFLMSCGKSKKENAAAQTEKDDFTTVRVTSVQQKMMSHDIIGGGFLGSKSESRPSFKTGGIISKIYVKEGDNVQTGQLLATLDMTEINAQVNQAQLAQEKAERDLQRAKNLYADTVATLEQVQNATTGADFARRTVEIARFNQRFSEIRATKSGRVLKKIMNEGELVGPGMPLFIINEAGSSDWVVRVGVSDRDWAALRVGNATTVTIDAYPNQIFQGKVSKLADFADPNSGTFEVEVTVKPSSAGRFVLGMYAHAKMSPSAATPMRVIPIEALVEGNGVSGFVFTPNTGGGVLKVPVKIVHIGGKEIGVAGLENVSKVITDGSAYLTEKSKIKIIE